MITNLVEPHVFEQEKRRRHTAACAWGKSQEVWVHLHLLDQQPLNDQGAASVGACPVPPVPPLTQLSQRVENPLTPRVLLVST